MKKITSIGSLAILTIFQLNAIMETQNIAQIRVIFSPTATQELHIPKSGQPRKYAGVTQETPMTIIVGVTTAGDVLKKIAVDNNIHPIHLRGLPSGEFEHMYMNEKLKDAYDKGLLSLWTIRQDGRPGYEILPHQIIETQHMGNRFYIRYNQ